MGRERESGRGVVSGGGVHGVEGLSSCLGMHGRVGLLIGCCGEAVGVMGRGGSRVGGLHLQNEFRNI